jgi:hypothetical protein
LQGEWKRLLWRPHIGQLLVLFSIATILFTSAVLLFVVPESRELAVRVRVLENVISQSLHKNQEAVLGMAGRIEETAKKLEEEAKKIHDDLEGLMAEAARRNVIREQEHKGIKEFLEKVPRKQE